eukprot:gene2198-5210_t
MADLGSQNKDSTPTQGDISEEAGINKIDEHNVLEQKEDVESESRQPRSTKPTGGLRNIISSVSRVIGSTRGTISNAKSATETEKQLQPSTELNNQFAIPLMAHFENQWQQLAANDQITSQSIESNTAEISRAHQFVDTHARQHRLLAQQLKVLPELSQLANSAQQKITDLHEALSLLDTRIRHFQATRQAYMLQSAKLEIHDPTHRCLIVKL